MRRRVRGKERGRERSEHINGPKKTVTRTNNGV